MSLRRKLLTIFGGLTLLALVIVGVTVWTQAQWQATEATLQGHYLRSLLLQRVRAATFRALKEVPDAVGGSDPNARQEFAAVLAPIEEDFGRWAELANIDAERQQVQAVRGAFDQLVRDAVLVFDLVDAGEREQAAALMEGRLEEQDLNGFQDLTEQAVASDRVARDVIRAQTEGTRRTAQLMLAVAAFGTLSLVLLLGAYLASDLFSPLREVEAALGEVARGDLRRRLDAGRGDELGALNRAFNGMLEAVARWDRLAGLAALPLHGRSRGARGAPEADGALARDGAAFSGDVEDQNGAPGTTWGSTSSRVALHAMVSQLRARLDDLHGASGDAPGGTARGVAQQQSVVEQVDELLHAIARLTEFGFPLDLNLSRTDVRALLYDVLLRFQEEFAARGVSIELSVAPEIDEALVDRLKLREALAELVRNALRALGERGGRIGLRASLNEGDAPVDGSAGGGTLLVEVADDGQGAPQPVLDRAAGAPDWGRGGYEGAGLRLTRAVIEQHGGELTVRSEPGQGTYARIALPLLRP